MKPKNPLNRREFLKTCGVFGGSVVGAKALIDRSNPRATVNAVDPPATDFIFALDVGALGNFYFQECYRIGSETEVEEYMEGGNPQVKKRPRYTKFLNPLFRRSMTNSAELWQWHKEVVIGHIDDARTDCTLVLYDDAYYEIARWNLVNAWPVEVNCELSQIGTASVTPVSVEQLVLNAEVIQRVSVLQSNQVDGEGKEPNPGPPLASGYYLLEVDGSNYGYFTDVSDLGLDVEVTKLGAPGRWSCRDVVLKRPISTDISIWAWRKMVEDGNVDAAKGDGSIVGFDEEFREIARWNMINVWPRKIIVHLEPTNGEYYEVVTLVCDYLERVK
jgi:phage tail-like protein